MFFMKMDINMQTNQAKATPATGTRPTDFPELINNSNTMDISYGISAKSSTGSPVFPGMQSYGTSYKDFQSSPAQPVNLKVDKPSTLAITSQKEQHVRQPLPAHTGSGTPPAILHHDLPTAHPVPGSVFPTQAPTMLQYLSMPPLSMKSQRSSTNGQPGLRHILPATEKQAYSMSSHRATPPDAHDNRNRLQPASSPVSFSNNLHLLPTTRNTKSPLTFPTQSPEISSSKSHLLTVGKPYQMPSAQKLQAVLSSDATSPLFPPPPYQLPGAMKTEPQLYNNNDSAYASLQQTRKKTSNQYIFPNFESMKDTGRMESSAGFLQGPVDLRKVITATDNMQPEVSSQTEPVPPVQRSLLESRLDKKRKRELAKKQHVEAQQDNTVSDTPSISSNTVSDTSSATPSISSLNSNLLPLQPKPQSTPESLPIEYDDQTFVWDKYLAETNSVAAPHVAFKHVEASLVNSLKIGMKLECSLPAPDSDKYWIASIVAVYGSLVKLRFDGFGNDGSQDFNIDIQSNRVHEIGWCARNKTILLPPAQIRCSRSDWENFYIQSLQGAVAVPPYLFLQDQRPWQLDKIHPTMCLEVQHPLQPTAMWIAQVIENVGGRLKLRYEGADSAHADFILFYLDERLHHCSWASTMPHEHKYIYKTPEVILNKHSAYEKWSGILQNVLTSAAIPKVPAEVFQNKVVEASHSFLVGQKLEAVHPVNHSQICPATITSFVNSQYFTVEMDDLQPNAAKVTMCCHARSTQIFPVRWCQKNGIKLNPPHGWSRSDFSWAEYLQVTESQPAPDKCFNITVPPHCFVKGMKLEAVNLCKPAQICVATITRIIGRLLWVNLNGGDRAGSNQIMDVTSLDLFPVGWCEANNYKLAAPRKHNKGRLSQNKAAVVEPGRAEGNLLKVTTDGEDEHMLQKAGSSECGPKVFFNHKCFSGPLLSKGRISELPKCVGPGPVCLVLKEVLTMLINVAYKSSRVLRELQRTGSPNPQMHQQMIKAKYKGKSYQAEVELCKTADGLTEFCRQVCIKLECCPNLISPMFIEGVCPESCHELTKTKYTHYNQKKVIRKPGRPPGGHTNLENGGRKKKKKKSSRHMRKGQKYCANSSISVCSSEDAFSSEGLIQTVLPSSNNLQQDDGDMLRRMHDDRKDEFMTETTSAPGNPNYQIIKPEKARGRPKKRNSQSQSAGRLPSEERCRSVPPIKIRILDPHYDPTPNIKPPKKTITSPIEVLPLERSALTFSHNRQHVVEDEKVKLTSNPLHWNVEEISMFIKQTNSANVADQLRQNEIDGQAFMMLVLPTVQKHLQLKLGPAIKLCHQVQRLKLAFYETFCLSDSTDSSDDTDS